MNQIKKDMLLKIHSNHPVTCPLINALQFSGQNTTKTYKMRLEYDPIYLSVDATELLKANHELAKWSEDLLKFHHKLSDDIKQVINTKTDTSEKLKKIEQLLTENPNDNIIVFENAINTIIKSWKLAHTQYVDLDRLIKKNTIKFLQNEKLAFQSKDQNEKDFYLNEIQYVKDTIKNLEIKKENIKDEFGKNILNHFVKETDDFTDYLEIVRKRNDELRLQTTEFRDVIIESAKVKMKIYQPIEYLNEKFGIQDIITQNPVVNLGVLNNKFEYMSLTHDKNKEGQLYFNKLVDSLNRRGFINAKQKIDLLTTAKTGDRFTNKEESRKKHLFQVLSENGYKTVRYYKEVNDFLSDPESFKIVQINKAKVKIRPVP